MADYDPNKPASDTNVPPKSSLGDLGRQALKELHDAIGSHLGLPKATAPKHQGKTIDEVVDEAIKGAPPPNVDGY